MRVNVQIVAAMALALGIASPTWAAPKIAFDKEVLDFGKVTSGSPINATYQFTNAGDSELEITGVRPGCGCTKAEAQKTKLAAGESSAITAVFNSNGYTGPISKSITVTTNDPARQTLSLQIKAILAAAAVVKPASLNFDTLRINGTKTVTLTVVPGDPKTFSITKVVPVGSHMSIAGYRKVESANGGFWEVYVVIKAGKTAGRVMETLRIENNLGPSTLLSVMVYGNVVS